MRNMLILTLNLINMHPPGRRLSDVGHPAGLPELELSGGTDSKSRLHCFALWGEQGVSSMEMEGRSTPPSGSF